MQAAARNAEAGEVNHCCGRRHSAPLPTGMAGLGPISSLAGVPAPGRGLIVRGWAILVAIPPLHGADTLV